MSAVSVVVLLICDGGRSGCLESSGPYECEADAARLRAQEGGWRTRGSRDLCPVCHQGGEPKCSICAKPGTGDDGICRSCSLAGWSAPKLFDA